jgi:coniferyl-aldehyde dehydrogenase
MKSATTRIMRGKTMNAGQICLAPDYVMVPKGKSEEFYEKSKEAIEKSFDTLKYNPDYTSVINEKHYERLNDLIEDAKAKGADVKVINPADEDFSQQEVHKIPPTLIMNPTDDMQIMKEEIFGPVLPVKEYENFQETINYVNSKDRPLGLYYFGKNKEREEKVLNNTISGGVTINDVIWHIGQEDLPFGGVGPSGIGNYHGFDGFKTFSHAKAIYRQFSADLWLQ